MQASRPARNSGRRSVPAIGTMRQGGFTRARTWRQDAGRHAGRSGNFPVSTLQAAYPAGHHYRGPFSGSTPACLLGLSADEKAGGQVGGGDVMIDHQRGRPLALRPRAQHPADHRLVLNNGAASSRWPSPCWAVWVSASNAHIRCLSHRVSASRNRGAARSARPRSRGRGHGPRSFSGRSRARCAKRGSSSGSPRDCW
jgi:hypothetical protein